MKTPSTALEPAAHMAGTPSVGRGISQDDKDPVLIFPEGSAQAVTGREISGRCDGGVSGSVRIG